MEILLSYLLSPAVFFSILVVILLFACYIIFSLSRETTRKLQEKDAQIAKVRLPLKAVEEKATEQEVAYKERILQLERALKASEEKQMAAAEASSRMQSDHAALRKTLEESQARLRAKEEAALQVTVLKNENDMLKKAVERFKSAAAPEESQNPSIQKLNILQEQLVKINQDLTLKTQLYDGLKSQYAELEKNFEGVMQQLEKEKKAQQLLSQRLWEISKT